MYIGHVAHEVDGDFILVRTTPHVSESHDFSVTFQHCDVEAFHVFVIEVPQREAFLAARLEIEPRIGNLAQAWNEWRYVGRRNDFKRQAVLVDLAVGISEWLATRTIEREIGEVNAGDFAELQGNQSHIQKQGQALRADTVEYGSQGKLVGQCVK